MHLEVQGPLLVRYLRFHRTGNADEQVSYAVQQ